MKLFKIILLLILPLISTAQLKKNWDCGTMHNYNNKKLSKNNKHTSNNLSAFDGKIQTYESKYGELTHEEKMEIDCNVPAIRDVFQINFDSKTKIVNLRVVVFKNSLGIKAVGVKKIEKAITNLNAMYKPHNIQFQYEYVFYKSQQYYNIDDDTEEKNMKETYAENTAKKLNVYVVNKAPYGGRGTFPWAQDDGIQLGTSTQGGIVMRDDLFNTAIWGHEVGHNLGLYHVHTGVAEVNCKNDSLDIECVTGFSSAHLDSVGDFCSDTRACPYLKFVKKCNSIEKALPEKDCCDNLFSDYKDILPLRNYMSYAKEECLDNFTRQQAARMHAYLTSYPIKGWLETPPEGLDVDIKANNDCAQVGENLNFSAELSTKLPDVVLNNSESSFTWVVRDIEIVHSNDIFTF